MGRPTGSIDGGFDLLDVVYQAAFDPGLWASFLRELAARTHADGSLLVHLDFRAARYNIAAQHGLDPHYQALYRERYHAVNPLFEPGRRIPGEGEVALSAELIPERELVRTEFCNDFLRPQGFFHLMLGAAIAAEPVRTNIHVLRSERRGIFRPREQELMRRLLPHVKTALGIHRRMEVVERERALAESVLDRLAVGVAIVDAQGRVIRMNRAAHRLIEARDGLVLRTAGIACHRHDETLHLARLVREAGATSEGRAFHPGGVMRVTRPSCEAPYAVLVAPLRGSACVFDHGHPVVAVFISDPAGDVRMPEEVVRALYGLTPAEARIAIGLVRGRSLVETADENGITLHTARTHLKRVFAKTDTGHQRDLVRLFLTGPALIGGE